MIVDLKQKLLEEARRRLESGEFEAGVQALERVILIARDDTRMVRNVHVTLGTHFLEEGDPRAIRHFVAALEIEPADDRVRYCLGHAYLEADRSEDAVKQFVRALEERPDDPEYLRCLGIALAEDGRMEEAVTRLRAAARLKPDDPLAHKDLAQVLSICNEFDEAETHARAAVRLCPKEESFREVLEDILQLQAAVRMSEQSETRKAKRAIRRPRKL